MTKQINTLDRTNTSSVEVSISKQDYLKLLNISSSKEDEVVSKTASSILATALNEFIYIKDGYKYNNTSKTLFDSKNNRIALTNMESRLIDCLCEEKGRIVPNNVIKTKVWGRKDSSTSTLRNLIRSIRNKTSQHIITNSSKLGYCIL